MFCTQCGSNIPDGSKFCHVCGADQVRPNANNKPVQQEQQAASESGNKGLIIGISIFATLFVAVAIVLIVLNPFKKDDKDKASGTTTENVAETTTDSSFEEASGKAYITNVVVNTSENDTTTNMERISIYDERYYHFELQGLEYGEEVELIYKVEKASGSASTYAIPGTHKNGDQIVIKYFDEDDDYHTGLETINVKYKDTKEDIGSISVKIVYNVADTTENTTESEEKKDNDVISDTEAVTAKEFTDLPLIFLQKGTDSAGVHYQLGTPHHTEISNGYLYEFFEYEYSGIDGTIYVAYPEDNDIFAFGLWTNININDATVDARNDDTVFIGRFNDDLSILEGSIKTSTGAEQSYYYDESGVKSIGYENKDNGTSIWITYNNNTGKIEVGIFYLD